jgi:tRNA-modifying protein YgfZ
MLSAFFENAALFELPGRGRIRASGEDRKRLVHAMTTNHVQQLEPGQGCYAFFLNAQGRILSDATILALPDHLLLDVEPSRRSFVFEHLDKYIIADDVVLEDASEQQTTLALEGPAAGEILESISAPIPTTEYGHADWAGRLVVRTSYSGAPGYHIYLNPLDEPVVRETLLDAGAAVVSADAAETARLLHGRPICGVDILDTTLTAEAGLDHAMHFSKGCYLGQEIVERVRSRGHANKKLTRLQVQTAVAPAAGDKVMAGDKEAGTITSAAFDPRNGVCAALALVRVEYLQQPGVLTVNGAAASA